jgi:hypothetical protein
LHGGYDPLLNRFQLERCHGIVIRFLPLGECAIVELPQLFAEATGLDQVLVQCATNARVLYELLLFPE